jgi:ABC-2 type transport system permease protein
MFDVLIAVVMGQWLFDVPLRGSLLLLFVMASVFLVGALSLGMMVSIATRSQLVASQLAMVGTFLPSFLLSGFMFAITNMPRPIQLVTYVIPARYFIALLKGIYLKGVGLELLWLEALLLAVFGAAILTLAIRLFRKSLE